MTAPRIQFLNRLAGPNLWLPGRGVRCRLCHPALAAGTLTPEGAATLARFCAAPGRLGEFGAAFGDMSAATPDALLIASLQALHDLIYRQQTVVRLLRIDPVTVELSVAALDLPVAEAMVVLAEALVEACFSEPGVTSTSLLDSELEAQWQRFHGGTMHYRLDTTTRALLAAATALGIPWQRFSGAMPCFQYGYGSNSQLLLGAETNHSGYIGRQLTHSKAVTNQFLRQFALPVARQWQVQQEAQLAGIARDAGYPLVVKPANLDKGVGVRTGIRDGAALVDAWRAARKHSPLVLVEQHLPGDSYRLLVLEGTLVAAALCRPARVVGDGRSSVRELVAALNRDPRRGVADENLMVRVDVGVALEGFLASQGYGFDSVPAAGTVVPLAGMANISAGGEAEDVTERVHPDNKVMAERAARLARLGITGIDFVTPDISRSWREVGGGIVEMNIIPGLRPHLIAPPRRPVPETILRTLFSGRAHGRIPVVGITGSSGKTTTAVMLAHILRAAGHRVGLATTYGIRVDDEHIMDGDWAGPTGAHQVLKDPSVTAAVLETSRGGLLRYGLAVPALTVGAVLNVRGDHVGVDGIDTEEELARVKRLVVEHASDAVVLNADDTCCLAMARYSPARRVVWVGRGERPAHVCADDGYLRFDAEAGILSCGGSATAAWQFDLATMPAYFQGKALHNGENALYAAAIAVALAIEPAVIKAALSRFDTSFDNLPGRLNVFTGFDFPVVLDFAHNADKLAALAAFAANNPVTRRRVLVLTPPARRTDEQIRAFARAAVGTFDLVICSREQNIYGRGEWEVQELARESLLAAGVDPGAIRRAASEAEAIDLGLALCSAGDALYITCDAVADAWHQLGERAHRMSAG